MSARVSRLAGLPGRPGEFRPEPPTDPDVDLLLLKADPEGPSLISHAAPENTLKEYFIRSPTN